MASRSKTVRKKDGVTDKTSYNVSPGNFWDVGNYSRCVKLISESLTLNEDLIKMYTERADIESKYSKKLTEWTAKWSKYLEESCMYATMKTAVIGTLKEADDRAKIHMDCWGKIHDHIGNIKRHKETNYHKALIGIKEAKDYDEDFFKAQKPWAVAYGKIQRAKKNYHSACKNKEQANQSLSEAQQDSEIPIEKIKKLEDALKKAEKQVEITKAKYEEKLSRIEPLNITYEQEMRKVYDRWARDEEKRKDFMQRALVDFHKAINICSDNRLKECFDNQLNVAYSGKSQYDVKWWSENFGADMPCNWPKFEELGDLPETPPPISAIEPPPSNSYTTNSMYNQNTSQYVPSSNYSRTQSYVPVSKPNSNPFANGDAKDGNYDDDDDDWDEPPPIPGGGVPVRALYDYIKVEDDELTFSVGDILTKLTEEDEQGWCRGRINGVEGLYPANYVEPI